MKRCFFGLLLCITPLLLVPLSVEAICLREGCQAVEIEVGQCDEVTFSNQDAIMEFVASGDPSRKQEWISKIVEFRGLQISGVIAKVAQIPCSEGDTHSHEWPVRFKGGESGTFFYLSPADRCKDLDHKLHAKFLPQCCDTLPPEGRCVIRLPLLEPGGGAALRGDGGGRGTVRKPPERPSRNSGSSDSILPKKEGMFDR
jgi:hypothetical protein